MATRLRAGGCTSAPERARAATADHARVHLPLYLCAVAMLRADKIRRPDLLIRCGTDLLGKHRSKLGSGVWDVREQVFTATGDSASGVSVMLRHYMVTRSHRTPSPSP